MKQIIYGDILFIINFSMDFLALYMTAKISRINLNVKETVFSAALGAIFSVISVITPNKGIVPFFIAVSVSLLMCYVAFGFGTPRRFFGSTLIFYTTNFLLGGCITAIFNAINSYRNIGRIYINGNVASLTSSLSMGKLLPIALAAALVVSLSADYYSKRKSIKSVNIEATYLSEKVSFEAFCDTGNLLCEPLSNLPVIVAANGVLNKILTDEFKKIITSRNCTELFDFSSSEMKRIRIIPANTVTGKGIMLAFKPDKLTVNGIEKDAYLAVDVGKNDFAGYEAIAPAQLV